VNIKSNQQFEDKQHFDIMVMFFDFERTLDEKKKVQKIHSNNHCSLSNLNDYFS